MATFSAIYIIVRDIVIFMLLVTVVNKRTNLYSAKEELKMQ